MGIGDELADALRARGDTCAVARSGSEYRRHADGTFELAPGNKEDVARLMGEAAPSGDAILAGLVNFWSVGASDSNRLADRALELPFQDGCVSTLHLLQEMVRDPPRKPRRLVLVTRGAQQVASKPTLVDLAQSGLGGMGRVIALEHPEVRCTRIDLDPDVTIGRPDRCWMS